MSSKFFPKKKNMKGGNYYKDLLNDDILYIVKLTLNYDDPFNYYATVIKFSYSDDSRFIKRFYMGDPEKLGNFKLITDSEEIKRLNRKRFLIEV